MFIEKVIDSLGELVQEVKSIYESSNELIWYRGHADKEWELVPSVQRLKESESEQYLSNDFYMKASTTLSDKPHPDNYSAWISIMRHFGLPTRLLDWSESPLIASFFATNEYKKYPEKDACIWILRPGILNKHEGFQEFIYPMDTKTCLDMIYPAFKKIKANTERKLVRDKIIATKPVEYNMRIYSQQSAFTIHNTYRKLTQIDNSNFLGRFIIPAKRVPLINYELSICGITLSKIYPDAENIALELKNKY
ncbi:FRG domain-containing protein [Clostridiaceae bacterium M8S5]|nr:FRG domain-containing protein [Clostridiaceae bacterium M8S5]